MKNIHIGKSDGILYWTFEPFLHITYRCLFRKIYLHNTAGVPANKPVLIAANHPTAFVDPIALCMFLDPPIYNMTRGDIFRKPWARRILESVNMFPVFRARDGYTDRERNDGVFEYCQGKMLKRQVVAVYVEGEHHLDKQVKTIQKGLARIAFGTYENHPMEDLQIIPVGTNYIFGDRTRDELKMLVGSPLFVKDYWEDYKANSAAAIKRLNSDIEIALKSLCYHIENKEDYTLAEQMLTMLRNDLPSRILPLIAVDNHLFLQENALLQRLNAMTEERKNVLKQQVGDYFEGLERAGLTDAALCHPEHGNTSWALFLIVGALPAALGGMMSWPVRFISRRLTEKLVKKKEFFTSVLMGLASVLGVFLGIILLLVGLIGSMPMLVTAVLLSPVLGCFFFVYRDVWERFSEARKATRHPERESLLRQRAAIVER